MKTKKILAYALVCTIFLSLFPLECIATFQTSQPLESQFNITIQDETAQPVNNANIYIYSYLDQSVVASATTDFDGTCKVTYMPDLKFPSNGTLIFGDYIVYVEKSGYQDTTYYLTKIYSESNDFDANNGGNISIELKATENISTENEIYLESETSSYDKAVYKYCVETGKISEDSSIYVITESDKMDMARCGITKPTTRTVVERFPNVDIPIGEFHVDPHSKLNVTFTASDSLKVEVGVDSGIAGISAKGSITRALGTTTRYPEFSTTGSSAQKKTYYTKGEFVVEETIIHSQGQIITTYRLDSIYGGTKTGATSQCTHCAKPTSAVENNTYGHYIPIDDGGTVVIEQIKNRTVELGLAVLLDGIDFDFGVTRITSSKAEIEYTPKVGYDIMVYDYDSSFKTWHVTSSTAK